MSYDIKEQGKFKYIEAGEGKTLVILHGLFGAMSNFEYLFDHFKDEYRVVIPMLPIYELPIPKTGVKSLAKHVRDFLDELDLKDVTLIGNSLGGHVSLVLYNNWPDRIHSMVLTGSSGLYENAFGNQYPKREDREFIREKTKHTFYDPKHVTEELLDEVMEIINNRNTLIRVLALAKSAIRHNMAKDIPNMKLPTCLIWGKNDNVTPPDVAEEFNQLMENSELHWIDKCGHAPMMEHPEEFNNILGSWLKKTRG